MTLVQSIDVLCTEWYTKLLVGEKRQMAVKGMKASPQQLANLKPFSKDNPPKSPGRRRSKIKDMIEETDLSSQDVAALTKMLFDMSKGELEKTMNDESKPILVRVYARSILQDLKNGNISCVETIANRTFGKPREMISLEHSGKEGGPIQINLLPAASAIVTEKDE